MIALAPSPAAFADPQAPNLLAWRTFNSENAGLQIDLPGEPRSEFEEDTSLFGTVAHHSFVLEMPDVRLDIERHDLPSLATFFLSSKRLLDRARDDLLGDLAGVLHGEADLTLQGYPGRRLRYRRTGVGHDEETRLVLAGSHLYIVSAEPTRGDASAIIRRFFDTFRICSEEAPCPEAAHHAPATGPPAD